MGQTASLVKLVTENKDCEWIYRFGANPGRPWGGIVPPTPVLAPGSALGSRPRVALSSAQAPSLYLSRLYFPRPHSCYAAKLSPFELTQSDPICISEVAPPSKAGITRRGARASFHKISEHWAAWCPGRL